MSIVYNILLLIDGAIYNLIDYVYDIFNFLTGINIFSQSDYTEIVNRIYVILGLFMMFVLAYSLLKAIINPDDFAKGEHSFPNLIKNVIISLVIIVLLPMVFSAAFNIQNVILNNETIPRLILGPEDYLDEVNSDAGKTMAINVFNAFFHPNASFCTDGGDDKLTNEEVAACKAKIMSSNFTWFLPSTWGSEEYTLADIDDYVLNGASFTNYTQFSDAVAENQISYTPLVSTVAGIFLLYVLLNFCFDLAVRVVKLAFYQIIAPVPVICRILPGGSMKDVFSKWVKQVISIFIEVFIRVGIMYLGVFIINILVDNFDSLNFGDLSFAQKNITIALLIMGVIIFIRQAPKLLGELLNLDTGGMKLGLMDKLAMGGGLIAGAAVGGLATTGIRNAVSGGRNVWNNAKKIPQSVKNAQGVRAKTKAILGGAGGVAGSLVGGALSTVAGAGSSFFRAGYAGLGAKNIKDMKGAASKGIAGAAAAKTKRENYKASHRLKIPVVGGIVGSAIGHGSDLVRGAGRFAGIGNIDALRAENAAMKEITNAEDAFNNELESALLKADGKGKDVFGGENIEAFRNAKAALDRARITGEGVSDAENAYKKAIKEVQQRLHTKLYSSQGNWDKLSDPLKVELGQLRVRATEYRGAIMNNASLQALKDAGIVGSDFAMNKDIPESVFYDPKDANGNSIKDAQGNDIKSVISKMGDNIKLQTASNDVNISFMKQNNTEENKK